MKLSFSNAQINAPWWWKRLETAAIFFFTGMIPIVSLIQGISPVLKDNLTIVILPLLVLAVKTIGIMLGDTTAHPENQQEKKELQQAGKELQQKWEQERENKPE